MISIKRTLSVICVTAILICMAPAIDHTTYASAASKPARVTIKSVTLTNQNVTIKWKKAKGAKKYQVFLKKGSGKWKKIATTTKKSYIKKKLAWNTKYQTRVRAINGKKSGPYSMIYKGKTSKKTTLEKEVAKNPSIRSKLDNVASGYDNDYFASSIGFKGNTMVVCLTSKTQVTPTEDQKAELIKNLTTSNIRKQMKSTAKDMENETGIYGIKIRAEIRNNDGSLIAGVTY